MDGIEMESCGDNGRGGNKPVARGFHPARGPLEGGVLQPLNAMRIATATARARKGNPLAEPSQKGVASVCSRVGTDAWTNSPC
eukprot:5371916-Prymnesium_polylepis.1